MYIYKCLPFAVSPIMSDTVNWHYRTQIARWTREYTSMKLLEMDDWMYSTSTDFLLESTQFKMDDKTIPHKHDKAVFVSLMPFLHKSHFYHWTWVFWKIPLKGKNNKQNVRGIFERQFRLCDMIFCITFHFLITQQWLQECATSSLANSFFSHKFVKEYTNNVPLHLEKYGCYCFIKWANNSINQSNVWLVEQLSEWSSCAAEGWANFAVVWCWDHLHPHFRGSWLFWDELSALSKLLGTSCTF